MLLHSEDEDIELRHGQAAAVAASTSDSIDQPVRQKDACWEILRSNCRIWESDREGRQAFSPVTCRPGIIDHPELPRLAQVTDGTEHVRNLSVSKHF